MISVATRTEEKEAPKTDHGLALVPLGTGYHQSPDLLARHRSVDTGLLAESLIYYDRVLINVDNPVRFCDLIGWLIQQGLSASDISALFGDGTLQIYNFAFTTNPFVEFDDGGIHIGGLYNFQGQDMLKPNSFFERFLGFEPLKECFAQTAEFDQFCSALENRVIEVKADDIGAAAIDNAWQDFLDPERNALIAQEFVNDIYRIKRLGKAPKVSVTIDVAENGSHQVRWNVPIDRLPALDAETNIAAAATIPLTIAGEGNKYLWAAEKARCDLYLGRPVSVAVGDKLFESSQVASNAATKITDVIERLEAKVEFPDVRRYVNEDKIDFGQVLKLRKKAKRFRQWLQSESGRDHDAIVAYHHEVAKESGFAGIGRRALRAFGFLSGAAVGAAISHDKSLGLLVGGIAGKAAQKGTEYLFDISASLGESWRPVCFGDWYKGRIEKLLKGGD